MSDWKNTQKELPPEGVIVETISPGGLQQTLKRQGRLWFHADGGMYVYYTPLFWRETVAEAARAK